MWPPRNTRPINPKNTRRIGWLLVAATAALFGYMAWRELEYVSLAQRGLHIDAPIVRIEVRRTGRRVDHTLFYQYEAAGKAYAFDDRSDRDRLEELHTATFNAFTREKPAFVVGGTIGLLVDPDHPEHHRADRAKLELPWLIWLRDVLAIVFLSAVSGFLLWSTRDPSAASAKRNRAAGKADLDASAQSGSEGSKSRVQSTTSHGTLSVEVDLDVPWPAAALRAGAGADASEALQKRMRELKAASGSSTSSKESSGFHGTKSSRAVVTSVRASLTLTAREDAVIEEARIELRSRVGTTERYTLARAQRVQAGEHSRLSGQWTSPAELTRVCIAITLTDGRHWSHELAI